MLKKIKYIPLFAIVLYLDPSQFIYDDCSSPQNDSYTLMMMLVWRHVGIVNCLNSHLCQWIARDLIDNNPSTVATTSAIVTDNSQRNNTLHAF